MTAGNQPGGLGRIAGPIWLDATRLLTRVGRGALSGIDRVELAYLDHLVPRPDARFLLRTTRGFLLLNAEGVRILRALAMGEQALPRADWISTLTLRGQRARHRAEAALRPFAIERAPKGGLARMVARTGAPAVYLNTGHSNLKPAILGAFSRECVAVLIHDLIPLTHPALVPPEQPPNFAARIAAARAHAGLIIANSQDTATRLRHRWGKDAPPILTAPIGITPRAVPLAKEPARYVMIGTLEPRKNQGMMIDVWEALARMPPAGPVPHLHIIGAPGWQSGPILDRLASHPLAGKTIFYHGPLPDAQVAEHLGRASALLYPSIVEGFGLPPFEALSAQTLPICSDLPVLREGLGTHAVYLPVNHAYSWVETIKQHSSGKLRLADGAVPMPTWTDHFDMVADGVTVSLGVEREGGE